MELSKLCSAHIILSFKHTIKPCHLETYLTDTWETHRKHLPSSGAHLTVLGFQIYSDFKCHCSTHTHRVQCKIVFPSTKKTPKQNKTQNQIKTKNNNNNNNKNNQKKNKTKKPEPNKTKQKLKKTTFQY